MPPLPWHLQTSHMQMNAVLLTTKQLSQFANLQGNAGNPPKFSNGLHRKGNRHVNKIKDHILCTNMVISDYTCVAD